MPVAGGASGQPFLTSVFTRRTGRREEGNARFITVVLHFIKDVLSTMSVTSVNIGEAIALFFSPCPSFSPGDAMVRGTGA